MPACTTPADAKAFATQQLHLAGLMTWTVQVRDPQVVSTSGCYVYFGYLDSSTYTLVLISNTYSGPPSGGNSLLQLDQLLRAQLVSGTGSRCLSEGEAVRLAEHDVQQLGIPASQWSVSEPGAIGATGATSQSRRLTEAGRSRWTSGTSLRRRGKAPESPAWERATSVLDDVESDWASLQAGVVGSSPIVPDHRLHPL